MNDQIGAILQAQWRTLRNSFRRTVGAAGVLYALLGLLWYGGWLAGAVVLALVASDRSAIFLLVHYLPAGLLAATAYWQLMPVLMASAGMALDLKRLRVYPIPHSQLFAIEVLLRVATAVEPTLLIAGLGVGLLWNPAIPLWAPLSLAPFWAFNLLLSAGVKGLLRRLFERKWIREITVLLSILAVALPQLLLVKGVPAPVHWLFRNGAYALWPWNTAAELATGRGGFIAVAALAGWVSAAWLFGRWQFEREMSFDVEAAHATRPSTRGGEAWSERTFRFPSTVLGDPLGALVEKEIRSLCRAPRFRLVFFMGFSFGLLIWLPMALRSSQFPESFFSTHYLVFASVYAMMLLGEACFWNNLGFDRSAVQFYYAAPLKFQTVLQAKNIAAVVFVLLDISIVALICRLLGMPMTALQLGEAYAVTLVFALHFLAMGNLGSVYYPRPMDPGQSWRSSSPGRFQAFLLLGLPLLAGPIVLAYLARYAFDSEAAFFGVLAADAVIGAVFYWVALDSAASAAESRKEQLIATLSHTNGPILG